MTTTVLLIAFAAVFAIALSFFIAKSAAETSVKTENLAGIQARFPGARTHTAADGSYLAVDTAAERVIVGRSAPAPNGIMPYDAVYPFSKIASVELVIDGNTVSRTNRGSQAVGAAVGALAFGGVGAIIGGLSGSTTTKETIRRIGIKIIADDLQVPLHEITFFTAIDQSKGDRIDFAHVATGRRLADEFHALLVVAIRTAERKTSEVPEASAVPEASEAPKAPGGLHAMVRQLKYLQDQKARGAITAEEYETQKQQALRNRG